MKKTFKIKHFGHTIEVKQVDGLRDKKQRLDGQLFNSRKVILIDANQAESSKLETLFHEVTHHIDLSSGLNLTEGKVQAIGAGFYDFLVNNKALILELLT